MPTVASASDEPLPATGARRSPRAVVLFQVGRFAVTGLIALAIVAVATSVATRRIGEREAISDVRTTTLLKAEGVVRPAVTRAVLDGEPTALAALGEVVHRAVLDTSLVRVKIWTEDGTIVYSDEPRLIRTRATLGADELDALRSGRVYAERSDLTKPENVYDRSFHQLLEVYLPIRAQDGERVLFEAYYRTDLITTKSNRLFHDVAPIWLGALVLLQLVQVPLAWSLARKLAARLREREHLLRRALEASEVERRQIASDLHDGPVQELSGVAFALSGAALSGGDGDLRPLLESSAATVRGATKELRSLIVDVFPPDFTTESFDSALRELLLRAEARGLSTRLSGDVGRLPDGAARLLYRGAQEGVRNVLKHAEASHVEISTSRRGDRLCLAVADDGRGHGPERAEAGHVGLAALRGLVADAGGSVTLRDNQPRGTVLELEVPL